jgi:hypothetical protein
MATSKTTDHEIMKGAERAALHFGAIGLGVLLMVIGVAMGVTLVMFPVGVGVGFLGLLAFLWGLFEHTE